MLSLKDELKESFKIYPKYKEMLFRRGYLLTSAKMQGLDEYPFYGLWREICVDKYYVYVHEKQTIYSRTFKNISVVIVGHAYNPFNMKYKEEEICEELIDAYQIGLGKYFDKISELSGLHVIFLVENGSIIACQDACSLTGCYFSKINNNVYIAEHPQLIADLHNLKMESNVEKLIGTKCYNIGNRHLPGNISPYSEIKRLGANTYLKYVNDFSICRFYPYSKHPVFIDENEKKEVVQNIGELIHNGIDCCTRKWEKCAISLSGGTDSKTTLACANGLYDKFEYFSFASKPQEQVDAEGARKICDNINVPHTFYKIPEENEVFENFDFIKKILMHNTSYFVNLADNEIRKYIYLHDMDAYDIELKSWASEVTRVFFERKYRLKFPKTINERMCSVFQTRYFGHPALLKWSDKKYFEFLKEIKLEKPLYNYEHTDLLYWEVRMGCWGVSVVSSQQLYHRVTMPMNNRKILELFLGLPREERKCDLIHNQIIKYMNSEIYEAHVEIPNLYFHSYRIWLEKLFFLFRTVFYKAKK